MSLRLSTYVIRLLQNGPGPKLEDLDVPVLVWETGPAEANDEVILATHAGGHAMAPALGEPLIFELRKLKGKMNPFAMGVTVGRNDNNDVVLEHSSISRFHAYFQNEPGSRRWKLVDAESRNGTWCGPLKLKPSAGVLLADRTRLKFGDLELTYMEPATFVSYVRALAEGG